MLGISIIRIPRNNSYPLTTARLRRALRYICSRRAALVQNLFPLLARLGGSLFFVFFESADGSGSGRGRVDEVGFAWLDHGRFREPLLDGGQRTGGVVIPRRVPAKARGVDLFLPRRAYR